MSTPEQLRAALAATRLQFSIQALGESLARLEGEVLTDISAIRDLAQTIAIQSAQCSALRADLTKDNPDVDT